MYQGRQYKDRVSYAVTAFILSHRATVTHNQQISLTDYPVVQTRIVFLSAKTGVIQKLHQLLWCSSDNKFANRVDLDETAYTCIS